MYYILLGVPHIHDELTSGGGRALCFLYTRKDYVEVTFTRVYKLTPTNICRAHSHMHLVLNIKLSWRRISSCVFSFIYGDENMNAREKSAKSTAPVPEVSRCLIHSRTSASDALTPRRSNAAFNCDDGDGMKHGTQTNRQTDRQTDASE